MINFDISCPYTGGTLKCIVKQTQMQEAGQLTFITIYHRLDLPSKAIGHYSHLFRLIIVFSL